MVHGGATQYMVQMVHGGYTHSQGMKTGGQEIVNYCGYSASGTSTRGGLGLCKRETWAAAVYLRIVKGYKWSNAEKMFLRARRALH